MKHSTFSGFIRSSSLALNLLFLTTAVAILAQTNSAQTNVLQLQSQPQSTPLQASKLEMADKLGWLVFTGLTGLAGLVGLATLEHKRRTTLKKNSDFQNTAPDEENYFG